MQRVLICVCLWAAASAAWSHGGGLNAEGCHHDRKNGGYHCHRGPQASAPVARPASVSNAFQPDGARSTAFSNCSQARAAGAAPVRRGDPGYGPHLDRDGDGVGCE
ncbi:excalibur calcium-binding domain-containing protein [Lysobacter sp. MMG2]|uniref:excalibur calcium-binding domain-containing protein n=1 Tax=Lysobacter sp. MMG2 TaxID=2801338 RepID=UPI001C24940F|nr:excalibur calcium-binding domain-containing protein [Lysobacter sp. MMG2]MBU8977512.1 excalibur calcium-binding domain-containing protein [Lysobacter sp. MMG2]